MAALNEQWWEERALTYQWMVPWRYVRRGQGWFVGGYGSPAVNVLDRYLESRADKPAVIDAHQDRMVTCRELYWDSATLARWWRDHGVVAGDRIFIAGAPSIGALTAWIAAERLGAVVVRSRSASDREIVEQMLTTESFWLVASRDISLNLVMRAQVRVLWTGPLSEMPRESSTWALSLVVDSTDGVLDPVPVEVNAIGVLLYGDNPHPYAYSGLGSLLGWHQTLAEEMGISSGDRVGIASEIGGLGDTLVLTLAILAAGAAAIWLDNKSRDDGELDILLCDGLSGLPVFEGVRVGVVRVAGEPCYRGQNQGSLRLYPDLAAGVYVVEDMPFEPASNSPASDRSEHDQLRGEVNAPPIPSQMVTVVNRLCQTSEVRDVAISPGTDGISWIWVSTALTPERLLARLYPEGVPSELTGTRLVAVATLPTTVEGRVAGHVLSAIAQGMPYIPLGGLAKAGAVEDLVRAARDLSVVL